LIAEHVAREGKMPDTESFDSNCITPGTISYVCLYLSTSSQHTIEQRWKWSLNLFIHLSIHSTIHLSIHPSIFSLILSSLSCRYRVHVPSGHCFPSVDRSQDEDRPFLAAGSRSGIQWYADGDDVGVMMVEVMMAMVMRGGDDDGDDDDDDDGVIVVMMMMMMSLFLFFSFSLIALYW